MITVEVYVRTTANPTESLEKVEVTVRNILDYARCNVSIGHLRFNL